MSNKLRKLGRLGVLTGAMALAVTVVSAAPTTLDATGTLQRVSTTRDNVLATNDGSTGTGIAWKDVPGMTQTIGSEANSALLLAQFTASSRCTGTSGATCMIRILADGAEMAPTGAIFDSPGDGYEGHSYEASRVVTNDNPSIVLKVQYKVSTAGTTFQLLERTLTTTLVSQTPPV